VLFVADQHPVGAFLATAADEPFCITVGPRRAGRDLDDIEPFGGKNGIEAVGERVVPVADQEAECGDVIAQVHQERAGGLGGPGRGRVGGHPENVHRAGADVHDEQNVESAQREGVEGEEVGGE
jgi:hypothetical protein